MKLVRPNNHKQVTLRSGRDSKHRIMHCVVWDKNKWSEIRIMLVYGTRRLL